MTQATCIYPSDTQESTRSLTKSILQVLGGALFLALCSKISIPLFFTPVPLSLQTFAVMLLGGLLGKKQGALSAATYLSLLAFGVPVAVGGDGGLYLIRLYRWLPSGFCTAGLPYAVVFGAGARI